MPHGYGRDTVCSDNCMAEAICEVAFAGGVLDDRHDQRVVAGHAGDAFDHLRCEITSSSANSSVAIVA